MLGAEGSIRKDSLGEEKRRVLKIREKMSAKTISLKLIERLARIVDGMGVASVGSNFGLENT